MNVVYHERVCYKCGLLWTWSAMNAVCYERSLFWMWSAVNVVCNERVFNEQASYECGCHEQASYECGCHEQASYERGLSWTGLLWT